MFINIAKFKTYRYAYIVLLYYTSWEAPNENLNFLRDGNKKVCLQSFYFMNNHTQHAEKIKLCIFLLENRIIAYEL